MVTHSIVGLDFELCAIIFPKSGHILLCTLDSYNDVKLVDLLNQIEIIRNVKSGHRWLLTL